MTSCDTVLFRRRSTCAKIIVQSTHMPRQDCDVTIYVSSNCANSRRLVANIRRQLPTMAYQLVDIANPRVKYPPTLTHVPCIHTRNNNRMYMGSAAFKWLQDTVDADSKIVDSEASGSMGWGGCSLPFSSVDGGFVTAQQPYEAL